jgi:uncharacterized protein YndB with AHSA1/START domain
MSDVEVTRVITADPSTVWRMVSDLTRMGEWSPEATGGRWLGAATGPAVGARFKGDNRKGWRRWSTVATVTEAEPGRSFAFDVDYGPIAISHWSYSLEPAEGGTLVTECWTDRRPGWMVTLSAPAMGVADRAAHNRGNMEATLDALQAAVEARALR